MLGINMLEIIDIDIDTFPLVDIVEKKSYQ